MIALPSIAFGGFSGSANGVTARQAGGRSILSVKMLAYWRRHRSAACPQGFADEEALP